MKTIKTIFSIIPAKSKSLGLKNKNLKKINNKSLIQITIESAKKSKLIKNVFLTSDSDKILKLGKKNNIEIIKRPLKLSNNIANANEVILHSLLKIKKKFSIKKSICIYLQPTSPLRTTKHIDDALKNFLNSKSSKTLISVCDAPYLSKSLVKKGKYLFPSNSEKKITSNRQKLIKNYMPNGAIYIFSTEAFLKKGRIPIKKIIPYFMNKMESIDIDDFFDLEIARKLYNVQKLNKKL